jgi:hypothetical protein
MRVSATLDDSQATSVTRTRRGALRRAWLQIHLWLGLTLGILGAVVGVTGSLLVFDQEIDRALNPQRYATSGNECRAAVRDYAQRAARTVGEQSRTINLRLPAGEGAPVVAFVRVPEGASLRRVYLDPPTGRVLDAPLGRGLVGWAHDLHESLTLREYNGREIVGAVGLAMLVSSLSGIYLWWPRKRITRRDFGFRRGFALSRNLHQTLGIYASLVWRCCRSQGAVIAFPDASRASSVRSPRSRRRRAASKPGHRRAARCRRMKPPHWRAPVYPGQPSRASVFLRGRVVPTALACASQETLRARSRRNLHRSARGTVLRQIDRASRTGGDAFLAYQRRCTRAIRSG